MISESWKAMLRRFLPMASMPKSNNCPRTGKSATVGTNDDQNPKGKSATVGTNDDQNNEDDPVNARMILAELLEHRPAVHDLEHRHQLCNQRSHAAWSLTSTPSCPATCWSHD